jgi:hypothetical protein
MADDSVDVLRIIGSVVDQFLDVSEILSRLVTCKAAHRHPSSSAMVINHLQQEPPELQSLVRHLIEQSRRPLTMARAYQVSRVVHRLSERSYCGPDVEVGQIEPWFHTTYGEDTAWDCIMAKLRAWIWKNADQEVTEEGMEAHLNSMITDSMANNFAVESSDTDTDSDVPDLIEDYPPTMYFYRWKRRYPGDHQHRYWVHPPADRRYRRLSEPRPDNPSLLPPDSRYQY